MNFNRVLYIFINFFLAAAWLVIGVCYLMGIKLNYHSVFPLMAFILTIHHLLYAIEYINNK